VPGGLGCKFCWESRVRLLALAWWWKPLPGFENFNLELCQKEAMKNFCRFISFCYIVCFRIEPSLAQWLSKIPTRSTATVAVGQRRFQPEPPNNKASQDSKKSQLQPFAQVVKDTDKLQGCSRSTAIRRGKFIWNSNRSN